MCVVGEKNYLVPSKPEVKLSSLSSVQHPENLLDSLARLLTGKSDPEAGFWILSSFYLMSTIWDISLNTFLHVCIGFSSSRWFCVGCEKGLLE